MALELTTTDNGRRRFLQSLVSIVALPLVPRTFVRPRGVLVQHLPVAGFQYHDGERIWSRLHVGDPLTLAREPDNKYDPRAVRVDWRGHKLGYVPRLENAAVAQMLDRRERLEARIKMMKVDPNPWKRVEAEIWLG